MSEQIVIETPENIAFGYDVAGIGSRFLATLIDVLLQGTLTVIFVFMIVLIGMTQVFANLPGWVSQAAWILAILGFFVIQFGYYIAFELFMDGQTPGKRLFNLRVIKENGYPLAVIDVLIRNLVRVIDFFPFAYGVGVITMFLNDRAKRLGDYAAGTLVVNVHEQVKLSQLQASAAVVSAPAAAPGIEYLHEPDIELAESFLQRRANLKNADVLAARIAATIRARIDDPAAVRASATLPDTVFLQNVVAAYRQAHSRR